jgi:hypothetical protein
MSTETRTDVEGKRQSETETGAWMSAVLAGLAGGVVMGVILTVLNPAGLTVAIPSLYGLEGGIAGWVIHLSNSAILGVVFAAIVLTTPLQTYANSVAASTGLGATYGVLSWIVTGSIVLPLWLQAVGSPAAMPVPTFAIPSLLWHLAYGIVLGAVFAFVENR